VGESPAIKSREREEPRGKENLDRTSAHKEPGKRKTKAGPETFGNQGPEGPLISRTTTKGKKKSGGPPYGLMIPKQVTQRSRQTEKGGALPDIIIGKKNPRTIQNPRATPGEGGKQLLF